MTRFFTWCDARELALAELSPIAVATYIEEMQQRGYRAPTIKQGVVARIVTGPHEAHRQNSYLADAIRRWSAEGGHPIEDLTAKDDLTPCPAGLRARRPSPMMDLYRKNVFSTRP